MVPGGDRNAPHTHHDFEELDMSPLRFLLASVLTLSSAAPLRAQAELNDLEMAHAAVTANHSDIAYAHLALAFSENEAIREFAETMIRDHSAVNAQVFALAKKLNVQAQDNGFSRQLLQDAKRIKDELSRLRGAEFDRYYAQNELRYHQSVNGVVANAFIPNVENAEVKQAFEAALTIFREHERHAEQMVSRVVASR
jgi:putative membrane protein